MYVKWLEMYGFKSFCEKTKINFDKGITAIVGPNGSGKSNITDAIKWALGEQSLKALRASKMDDIIFAGTQKRKSLGFSEVSICFDNSNKMLNIDYDEVVITRRMFKTGENEYYINKTLCRLKDIYELLLDTGLGKDGYSIISQGKVDEIINARPFERFHIFEEACGITRYKYRKEETERKLKNTQDNILRLQDIINELLAQIDQIRPDVQKAKVYQELNNKLLKLKEEKYIYIYNKNYINLQDITNVLEENKRLIIKLNNDLTILESRIDEKFNTLEFLKNKLEELKQNQVELKSSLSDDLSRLKIAKNQLLTKQNLIDEIDKESFRLSESKDLQEKELIELKKSYEELVIKNKDLLAKSEQTSLKIESIKSDLNGFESELKQNEIDLFEFVSQIEKNTQKINGFEHLKKNLLERKRQIELEFIGLEKEVEGLSLEFGKNQSEFEMFLKDKEAIQEKLREINIKINSLLEDISNQRKELDDISKEVIKRQEKLRIYESMDENFEGYNKSVKEVFKRVKNSSIRIYGTVGSLISVQKKYIKAIDSALGSSIQYIVVQDEEDAKNIMEIAKKEKLGKVTIVPLDTVNPLLTKEKMATDGFLGYADEIILVDEKYKKVIQLLLGKTLVFDTIDNAITHQKGCNFRSRCVTLSGELINPGGIFVGGERKADFSILERKIEKEELKNELFDLERKSKTLETYIHQKYSILEKLNAEKLKSEESLDIITKKIDDIKKANEIIKYKKYQLEQKKAAQNKERDLIDTQIAEIQSDIVKISDVLSEIKSNKDKTEEKIQYLQKGIQILKDEYDTQSMQYNEIFKMKNEYQTILGIKEHQINEISKNLKTIDELIFNKSAQKQELEKEIVVLENEIQVLSCEIKNKQDLSKQVQEQINRTEQEYNNLERSYKKDQEEAALVKEKMHDIEMNMNRLIIEKSNIENNILSIKEKFKDLFNCEIKLDERIIEWDGKKDAEIENISYQIKELGEVNLYSIEQEKKILERINFLKKQVDDLERTSSELKELIDHLDKEMNDIFKGNFERIKSIFYDIFKELFNGGSCDLSLIEKDGEFGIDINIQPPGKKLQNISLLSGGEKALTAIALLFSFLTFKNSVFCILDEIDSSLDEVNVQRFASFLKNFNDKSQIIIVTHRKSTMEIANILYGVTMEEQGVSKILSLNIENLTKG